MSESVEAVGTAADRGTVAAGDTVAASGTVAAGGAAVVHLPRSLVALFPGAPRTIEASGATVGDLIADIDRRVPGLRNRLVDAGPVLRPHINVFVDGDQATLQTAVPERAVVQVMTAVSGG